MIKANELRIGNWVDFSGKYFQVHTLSRKRLQISGVGIGGEVFEYTNINPIPLTPEILVKCGFEKDRNGWQKIDSQFSLTENLFPCWLDRMLWPGGIPNFDNVSLNCVHQLQNLYYCLCGEELNIQL